MFSPKVKKFLSGIMITGDLLLGAVFFADLLVGGGSDIGIDLFLLAFLSADALLSLDYIGRLTKEEKEEKTSRRYESDQRRMDRKMAQEISSKTEALDPREVEEEMDPDELAQLLRDQSQNQSQSYRR